MFLNKKILIYIAVLILIGIAVFFYVGKETFFPGKDSIRGRIFLSLPSLSDKEGTGIYYYHIQNNKLKKVLRNKQGEIDYITNSFSSDKDSMAFVVYQDGSSQIYTSNKLGNNRKQITNSSSMGKMMPRWSPDNSLIAFQARRPDVTSYLLSVENWDIYVTNLEGEEKFISKGVSHSFLPNGDLVLLKSDGFYIFNTSGEDEGKLVLPTSREKSAFSNVHTAVSKDGKYFAVSDPGIKKINLFEIILKENDLFSFEKIKSFESLAYQPVFSPDSKYLAVKEINKESKNPEIVVYNLETFGSQTIFDLSGYNRYKIYITDWMEFNLLGR